MATKTVGPSSEWSTGAVLFWVSLLAPVVSLLVLQETKPEIFTPAFQDELLGWWDATVSSKEVWLKEPKFWVTVAMCMVERVSYFLIWTNAPSFKSLCDNSSALREVGTPVDVLHKMFVVFKMLQLGSLTFWYLTMAPVVDLTALSYARIILGTQMIIFGQVLNAAIFNAIGKAGVYYGCRLGQPVKWYEGFPFTVIRHPQYIGVLMTCAGAVLLLATEAHVANGMIGLLVSQFVTYAWTMYVEDKM